jgi:hypothetical protein
MKDMRGLLRNNPNQATPKESLVPKVTEDESDIPGESIAADYFWLERDPVTACLSENEDVGAFEGEGKKSLTCCSDEARKWLSRQGFSHSCA